MVPGQSIERGGKLAGLQVLRGIAALLVVWCHLKYILGLTPAQLLKFPLLATDLGGIGVDIFFVISGFVIALTADRIGRNWRYFLIQRVSRIVPLYFTVSCALLIMTLLLNVAAGANDDSKWLNFPLLFNTFGFIPMFDRAAFTNPVCINGWTLSFEMWFYLGFTALMCVCGGQKAGRLLPLLFVVGVAVTALFYPASWWYLPKFLFSPLTLEFAAGCLLYHVRSHLQKRGLIALYLSGLTLMFFAVKAEFLGQHQMVLANTGLGFYRAGVWGGFAACLVGVVTQIDYHYPCRWPRVLLRLGDASYSIYLIAPIMINLLQFTNLGLHKLSGHEHLRLPPWMCGSLYLLGTMVGGIWLWKYYEIPATRLAKGLLSGAATRRINAPALAETAEIHPT